jgi:hypothetical protein
MNAPILTPVALEFDPAYKAGRTLFDHLAVDIQAREVLRKALSESGGAGTDTLIVDPMFSPRATVEDLEWFRDNSSRTHSIRPAIDREPVLAGRNPANQYAVIVRQIGIGIRVLVAIAEKFVVLDPTTRAVRYDTDDVLSLLFEWACRTVPDDTTSVSIDKIVAYVDVMRSATAVAGSDSKRRLLS